MPASQTTGNRSKNNTTDGPAEFQGSEFQGYRAPRRHGETLIDPALERAESLLRDNQRRASTYPPEVSSLRDAARTQLLRDARRYTGAYRDPVPGDSPDRPIVMAGHQPTLFHPGVWFKNFALDQIASRTGSVAVNLVIDSDVAGASSIRVPTRHRATGKLGYESVAYDRLSGGVPYEQALIEDRDRFDSFDRSVADAVSPLVDDPLIGPLWEHARDAIRRCGFAGCALAQARHRLEADLGLQTLEIPQSVVCRGEAFARFVMHLLSDLPRFHACYNGSVDLYRQVHGIRSSAHPVPNLGRDGDWYETPLWVYGAASPKRRGLWVRFSSSGRVMELSDRGKRHRKIDNLHSESAFESFLALASPEFKIRSRALLTTMYARTVLSDLFLHGIGGGKYDQLGDLISRRFWSIDPPAFMVLSSTVLLPGHERHPVGEIDRSIRQVQRTLRDLEYQPESFAGEGSVPPEWIAKKEKLLSDIPPKGQRYDWHQEITAVNQQMAAALAPLREQWIQAKAELTEQRREAVIWNHREHPFCIYPLGELTAAYREMLRAS